MGLAGVGWRDGEKMQTTVIEQQFKKVFKLKIIIIKEKKKEGSLAGVAQWIECLPADQRVTGSIPSQGTCLGCRLGPQKGVHKRQPHIDISLRFFLPSPLSKNK